MNRSFQLRIREILLGTCRAPCQDVIPAKRFEDLIVWKLAVSLRRLVFKMTTTGRVATDFKFRDQIRNSARSAPSNSAEGFKRFDPPEFAHLLKIALASLAETQDHLIHGRDEKYFTEDRFTEAWRLSCRALKAGNRLHDYLRSCPKKGNPPRRTKSAKPGTNPAEPRTNPVEPQTSPGRTPNEP